MKQREGECQSSLSKLKSNTNKIMNDYERKHLEDFFRAIESNLPGYRYANFSYLALKNGEAFELSQGRLNLQGVPAPNSSRCFQSENVRAGVCLLSELKLTPRGFVDKLFTGVLQTPHGDLLFSPEQERFHSVYFSPFHSEGISTQRRQIQLSISGNRRQNVQSPSLDWELKAAPTPFFNLQELCDEFAIGQIKGDLLSVEILAFNIAAISAESAIDGIKANLAIDLAEGLQREKASIGYRIFEKNKVVKRGTLSGSDLLWVNIDNVQRGRGELELPAGAVLDCVANYASVAQSHRWIFNPKTAQNPYWSVHQTFDNNLEVLQAAFNQTLGRGANSRDVEVAVAWLLWMLGFSVSHISGIAKTTDAPDLIAATPQGNLLVIECTMGILKEDNKLPHLVGRAEKVRQNLSVSGNQHLRVLPVIVTTKTREEVKADLEQAYKLGVYVVTREVLTELTNRTKFFPDSNQLYLQAEEALRRLQNPPQFPNLFGEK
jgi:Holliday junction resolvase